MRPCRKRRGSPCSCFQTSSRTSWASKKYSSLKRRMPSWIGSRPWGASRSIVATTNAREANQAFRDAWLPDALTGGSEHRSDHVRRVCPPFGHDHGHQLSRRQVEESVRVRSAGPRRAVVLPIELQALPGAVEPLLIVFSRDGQGPGPRLRLLRHIPVT